MDRHFFACGKTAPIHSRWSAPFDGGLDRHFFACGKTAPVNFRWRAFFVWRDLVPWFSWSATPGIRFVLGG